ncbi:hypothetical protein [Cellulomonas dongxiuzhuiae]|uniref:hypothetical protein n=1 Tax=Cellulomonas dongxiuzhuiae TaxID=2819979 RepID=UPI001AAE3C61|nr:hypothetical protein [Cellulomonas dongxiuzhuiae]MBO3088788.1 hypothetical protein [Cellulomonas dongxiuzhuiae]
MASDLFGGWIQESDGAQSRRIRELTDDLDYMRSSLGQHSRAASALRSDLASLRGSIETRLVRLTEAFDAFVELSSLRDQLSLVAGPALVRQATRARLAALGTAPRDGGPLLDVSGTPLAPGYWLADALGALGPDDEGAAERAAAIDRRRTATFLAVAGAACGRADLVARWASDALGTLDPAHPVTRAQRAVWVAAAQGRLGDDARAVLLARLRAAVGALPATTVEEAVSTWTAEVRLSTGGAGTTSRTTEASTPPVPQVRQAAAALTALRALLDAPVAPAAVPVYGTPAGSPGDAGTEQDEVVPGDVTLDELVAVLRALVDEGAEEERALMTRTAELEAVVTGRDAPGPGWDAPAGDLLTLLRQDALTRRDATGAAARDACASWLVTVADTFLTESDMPPPAHLEGPVMGVTLQARPTGPVDGVDAALVRARTPQHPRTPRGTWTTVGVAVGAAVLWLAAAIDGSDLRWLHGTVAVALTITAGVLVARRVRRTREDATRATRGAELVGREAKRLQDRITEVTRVVESSRQEAREQHAHVVAALGRPATGPSLAAPDATASAGRPDAATTDAPVDA